MTIRWTLGTRDLLCVAVVLSIINSAPRLVAQADASKAPFTIAISAPRTAKVAEEIRVHVVLTNISGQELVFRRAVSPNEAEQHFAIRVWVIAIENRWSSGLWADCFLSCNYKFVGGLSTNHSELGYLPNRST